MMIALFFQNLV